MSEETKSEQHSHKENHFSASSRMSMVAVILSVAALLTSIIEVNFVRQELRSEAWPYLALHTGYNSDGFYLSIENKGVGPARLRSVRMSVNDKEVTDLDQAIIDTLGEEDAFSYELYYANDPAPGVLSSGEVVNLFGVPWEPRTRKLVDIWMTTLAVEACYCSIYDDCWKTSLEKGDPVEVASCKE